jgi:hypothetical protein
MFGIVYLEIRHMASGWAGLPGFLFALPLSLLVVTGYFLASYATEVHGYNLHVTEYHAEYGYFGLCVSKRIHILSFVLLVGGWLAVTTSKPPPPPPRYDFKA